MFQGILIGYLHEIVTWLLYPVLFGLLFSLLLLLVEFGVFIAELLVSLKKISPADAERFSQYAALRLERTDLLARSGPILGLMGTLIPLGPGLVALGEGDLTMLSTALTVAFDTTVLGLVVGLLAYLISRIRRRVFEATWRRLQQG